MNELDEWDVGDVEDVFNMTDMLKSYGEAIKEYKKLPPKKVAKKDMIAEEDVAITSKDRMFESFAKEAMGELVACGKADFVLLRNDKLRKWWAEVQKKELEAQIKREAIERKKMLKEQGLAKLSDEEKEALGLSKKK